MKINPYINFNGNTEEAFNFYKSVFGGEFAAVMRFEEAPDGDCDGEELSAEDKHKIMHIALPIGDGNVLMGTDMLESMGQKLVAGNNFSLSVNPTSKEDAERIFNGLAQGGKVEMPLADTFWGDYFGMLRDQFGMMWMVNFDYQQAKR